MDSNYLALLASCFIKTMVLVARRDETVLNSSLIGEIPLIALLTVLLIQTVYYPNYIKHWSKLFYDLEKNRIRGDRLNRKASNLFTEELTKTYFQESQRNKLNV